MTRSRSEYLRVHADAPALGVTSERGVRLASDDDRDALADLVLDAYRDTVDDEGEGSAEARQAVDDWLAGRIAACSVVIEEGERIVATAAARKRQGLGHRAVCASVRRLHDAGFGEVGATITDGNVASESLFASLGFVRLVWGPGPATSDYRTDVAVAVGPGTRPQMSGPVPGPRDSAACPRWER